MRWRSPCVPAATSRVVGLSVLVPDPQSGTVVGKTDPNVTIGRWIVSDRNLLSMRCSHQAQDGEVKVCQLP